ncbi:hypothetical protein LP419_31940 [Massilia sp. H-1]|nr:hypothetical protein LP419_31940 [Massilia sp. H-1]
MARVTTPDSPSRLRWFGVNRVTRRDGSKVVQMLTAAERPLRASISTWRKRTAQVFAEAAEQGRAGGKQAVPVHLVGTLAVIVVEAVVSA